MNDFPPDSQTRKHWESVLPFIVAFIENKNLEFNNLPGWRPVCGELARMSFTRPASDYRMKPILDRPFIYGKDVMPKCCMVVEKSDLQYIHVLHFRVVNDVAGYYPNKTFATNHTLKTCFDTFLIIDESGDTRPFGVTHTSSEELIRAQSDY